MNFFVILDIFIASTLCNKKFEERTFDSIENENDSFTFYIWSCNNQYMPKVIFVLNYYFIMNFVINFRIIMVFLKKIKFYKFI